MKMKRKNFEGLLLCLMTMALTSCQDDFLEENPVSNLSTQTFFETEDDFRQAANSVYNNLHTLSGVGDGGLGVGGYWAMSEMRSDNTTFQYNPVDISGRVLWNLDNFLMLTTNPIVEAFWNASYQGIGKANIVIVESEEVDYSNKAQIVAEAKFLRALYYSYLVRYFGNVPLVLEPTTSYEDAFANNVQVDKEQVYDLIISDLNEAKNNLPVSYSSAEQGKATSGAARTLLAKVLMELEQYDEAATELETVMSTGEYMLLDNYAQVFDINNENNREIVFSVQYIEGTYGLSSNYMYKFSPWSVEPDFLGHGQEIARTGMNLPTTDLIDSFEEGDERKSLINLSYTHDETGYYQGNIVPFHKKFWHEGHDIQYQTGANFPLFRYPHVLLMLAECYQQSGAGDAASLVNQVRQRAGLPAKPNVSIDDIIDERRFEFYGEADRWDVLVRTGRVYDVMEAHGVAERQRPTSQVNSEAYTNIKILYPIPAAAIQTDPSLVQNPEY